MLFQHHPCKEGPSLTNHNWEAKRDPEQDHLPPISWEEGSVSLVLFYQLDFSWDKDKTFHSVKQFHFKVDLQIQQQTELSKSGLANTTANLNFPMCICKFNSQLKTFQKWICKHNSQLKISRLLLDSQDHLENKAHVDKSVSK